MRDEDYPAEQIARIEFATAIAALSTTQRVRFDQLDLLHGKDDLAVMVREGLMLTEGVIAQHAELTPKGLSWINRRLLARRVEQGSAPAQLPRMRTHQPTMSRWDVREVPIGSILSLYGSDGPHEVAIVDRRVLPQAIVLVFSDGTELPYEFHYRLLVFAPLKPKAAV